MANATEDAAQPAENKYDEADEPNSPTDKGKQPCRKSKVQAKIIFILRFPYT